MSEEPYLADKAQALLKTIQEDVVAGKEPGCLTFRISRYGNEFLLFEEYENAAALKTHNELPKFKAFAAAAQSGILLVGGPKVAFYEEITHDMSTTFEHLQGKIIIHARVTAQEGQGDKVQSMLKDVRAEATSDKEPGVSRAEHAHQLLTENAFGRGRYENAAAINAHFEGAKFKDLVAEVQKGTLVVGVSPFHALRVASFSKRTRGAFRGQASRIIKKFEAPGQYGKYSFAQ
ncbi:hypothetical protein FRC10_005021 [Ceratobasidium sp. 414]|nr:hypothetical protein FRC10_005021 [Ceratobasidium sp. 414]